MTEGEKRVAIILINYRKGKYTLAYLNDVLARGLMQIPVIVNTKSGRSALTRIW